MPRVPSVRADLLPVVLAAGVGFAAVGLYLVAAIVFFPEMCLLGLRAMQHMSNVAYW